MKSNEIVKMNVLDVERKLDIELVGDNNPELQGEEVAELVDEEIRLLDFIKSVDFSDIKQHIVNYINYQLSIFSDDEIEVDDLMDENVFSPTSILINVTDDMDDETAEVALFAESDMLEEGVLIAFKDGKYFGISEYNPSMNEFEEFEE